MRGVTPGEKLQVWFPRARTDAFQQVRIVSITSDLPLEKTSESKYGNSLFYAIAPKAAKAEYKFEVEYDVVREERTTFPGAGAKPKLLRASAKQASEFLGPDKLVPVTGRLADLAAEQVQGRTTTMDRSRALYD